MKVCLEADDARPDLRLRARRADGQPREQRIGAHGEEAGLAGQFSLSLSLSLSRSLSNIIVVRAA
eukprot:6738377-Heterocapsa_arctica.AAC.1